MSNEINLYGNYIEFDHAPTDEEILDAKVELACSMRDAMLMLPCFIIKDPIGLSGINDPLQKDSEPRWTVGLKVGLFIDPEKTHPA